MGKLPLVRDKTDEDIGLEGYCHGCHRKRYYSPPEAEAVFGRDTAISHAERRLRCVTCGATGRSRPGVTLRMSIFDFYRGVPGVGAPSAEAGQATTSSSGSGSSTKQALTEARR